LIQIKGVTNRRTDGRLDDG